MQFMTAMLLSASILASPAAAATVSYRDAPAKGGTPVNVIELTLNLVRQINIPVTVTQAIAVGVNSRNTTAVANSTVTSINESFAALGGSGRSTGAPAELPSVLRDSLSEFGIDPSRSLFEQLAGDPGNGFPVGGIADAGKSAGDILAAAARGGLPADGSAGSAPVPVPVPAALPLALAAFGGFGLYGFLRRRPARAA